MFIGHSLHLRDIYKPLQAETLCAWRSGGRDGLLLLQDRHPADQAAQSPLSPGGGNLISRHGGDVKTVNICGCKQITDIVSGAAIISQTLR